MKIPTSIWNWQNKGLSIIKIMVLLWSTSVEKRIVALPLLSFSPFFCLASLASLFFIGFFGLIFYFLTWDNALIMKIVTLLFTYNSRITTRYLEQNMTLYKCLRRCTEMCNESRVTCMKIMRVALPQIQCQLHDHAKSNMTMMERVIINRTVKSCMAIYLGMAMEMP